MVPPIWLVGKSVAYYACRHEWKGFVFLRIILFLVLLLLLLLLLLLAVLLWRWVLCSVIFCLTLTYMNRNINKGRAQKKQQRRK